MDFIDYQIKANKTAVYPNQHSMAGLMYCSLGLAGEAGELCNKIKKIYRDYNCIIPDEAFNDLEKEIGDCLWYLAQLCSELSLSLNHAASSNIQKLLSRKERNTLHGSGDNR